MTDKPQADQPRMETFRIPGTKVVTSRIGLGTWAIGGWMWGGTDEVESIRTIHAALDRGITLIDTAPVYGFGRSEEIVGKALAEGGRRAGVVLATKVALDWKNEQPFRNGSRARITKEIDDSLRRLRTDVIDSIKFTGRIRIPRSRKLLVRWPTCSRPGRSAPSA
jgi:aryl-alcohol dehydrogenase-like predicted oxidoreductase